MSIKFIFEDKYDELDENERTPSSVLLKSCYNSNNIYFSNGNNKIIDKLDEIYTSDDLFIIFLDVVPNNKALIVLYNQYIERIENDNRDDNVCIIPILCIEYYIIMLLDELNILFTKDKVTNELYSNLYKTFNWYGLSEQHRGRSIEKLYKELVNLQKPYCLRNTNSKSISYYGLFYKKSCLSCNDKHCKAKLDLDLKTKAEFLYTLLPVFDVLNTSHSNFLNSLNINCKDCSIDDAKLKMQKLYDILCDSMDYDTLTVL